MKISSRNVNGIRAVIRKDFFSRVKTNNFDMICLQEVKAFETQIPSELRFFLADYDFLWHRGTRAGYGGTAIFYKKGIEVIEKKSEFSFSCFHEEGRVTQLNFRFHDQEFALLNLYFPNWGTRADGTQMLSYKLEFYQAYRTYLRTLREQGKCVISTGDFNICHKEIDIARPEENKNSIGFLPIERAEMDTLVEEGYVDVFRHCYPDAKDKYTRRSYRSWAKERNVGRRLDYFRVSENVLPFIKGIEHQESLEWSDHCPIVLSLAPRHSEES